MQYLIIDTESCTGKSDDGSLCSFGYAIADENFNIIERNDLLINPLPKRFAVGDKKNLKRTGVMFAYGIDEFRRAPTFKDRYADIKRLFEGRLVLGFAMANDVKYLNDACDKYSLPRIEYEYMDVQFVYKLLNPDANSIGLKTLAEKYGIKYLEHRSDEDAVVSLSVLIGVLEENKVNYCDFIKNYEVVYGVNTSKGHHQPYSVSEFKGEKGLSISHRLKNLVYSDYLSKLPKRRKGEVYCFAYSVERNDVDMLRTLINAVYRSGNSYNRDGDVCTVYVTKTSNDEDERLSAIKQTSKRLKRVISFEELKKELNVEKAETFDDTKFLIDFHEKLIY
ncbi:MAG: hypothetical protein PUI94_00055 [Eubacteriales bacterium]|nr:hypothetical protein [Eubacteriales bacterium]